MHTVSDLTSRTLGIELSKPFIDEDVVFCGAQIPSIMKLRRTKKGLRGKFILMKSVLKRLINDRYLFSN